MLSKTMADYGFQHLTVAMTVRRQYFLEGFVYAVNYIIQTGIYTFEFEEIPRVNDIVWSLMVIWMNQLQGSSDPDCCISHADSELGTMPPRAALDLDSIARTPRSHHEVCHVLVSRNTHNHIQSMS
jgi:hypothetical protein